jgi:signal recognition particle GTPase
MKTCLVNALEARHVCVLHGLGGAGKTQLALKFANLYKNEWVQVQLIWCLVSNVLVL